MEDSNFNNNVFFEEEIIILKFLFNIIIPESKSALMPSAAILINSIDLFSIEFLNLIRKSLSIIDLITMNQVEKKWASFIDSERTDIINEFKRKNVRFYNKLSLKVVSHYYSNEVVLKSIGIKSIPLFPEGNSVLEGDLLLLENVFLKNSFYRI
jgi:hypothetical protein